MKFYEIQQLYSLHRHTASNLIWSGRFWKVLFGRNPCSKRQSWFYDCSFLGRGSLQRTVICEHRKCRARREAICLHKSKFLDIKIVRLEQKAEDRPKERRVSNKSRRFRTQFNSWLKKYSHLLACVALHLRRCYRRRNHNIYLQTLRIITS